MKIREWHRKEMSWSKGVGKTGRLNEGEVEKARMRDRGGGGMGLRQPAVHDTMV